MSFFFLCPVVVECNRIDRETTAHPCTRNTPPLIAVVVVVVVVFAVVDLSVCQQFHCVVLVWDVL